MDEILEFCNTQIDSLNIEISAAEQRQDVEGHIYLRGKKQGVAAVMDFIKEMAESFA